MNWWPLVGLGALALWTKSAGAATQITREVLRQATRRAGKLAVFPVEGGKLSTKARHGYLFQRTKRHKHRGIDIFMPVGTPVLALFAGKIVHTNRKWKQGYGGYGRTVVEQVLFRGERYYLLFAHLDSVDVRKGDTVKAGEQLGTIGLTEFTNEDHEGMMSTGPHLHFELADRRYPMRPEAPRIDPTELLRAAQSSPFTL